MRLFAALVILFSAILASASPRSRAHAHRKRAELDTAQHCGHWDSVHAGKYILGLNQWGASGATGRQCAQVTKLNGNTVAWETTYNWNEGLGIKSFTNIQLNVGINQQLSNITSMPTVWDWSMSRTDVVADVAYDLFTSYSPGGNNVNEIMIWLANYSSGPISYHYTAEGNAVPVASGVNIAGKTWTLYVGSNGANKVFSFLPAHGPITTFKNDIFEFFKYLMKHQGLSSSQYLITAQGGSESTSGSATLTTTKYSLAIH